MRFLWTLVIRSLNSRVVYNHNTQNINSTYGGRTTALTQDCFPISQISQSENELNVNYLDGPDMRCWPTFLGHSGCTLFPFPWCKSDATGEKFSLIAHQFCFQKSCKTGFGSLANLNLLYEMNKQHFNRFTWGDISILCSSGGPNLIQVMRNYWDLNKWFC